MTYDLFDLKYTTAYAFLSGCVGWVWCVSVCFFTQNPAYDLSYVRTYARTYIRNYVRTYVPTYVRSYVRTYVRTYVRSLVYTSDAADE